MVYPTRSAAAGWPQPHPGLPGSGARVTAGCAPARRQWRVEAWLGEAWSAPTRVTFSQIDQPDIRGECELVHPAVCANLGLRRAVRAVVGRCGVGVRVHAPQDLPRQSAAGRDVLPGDQRRELLPGGTALAPERAGSSGWATGRSSRCRSARCAAWCTTMPMASSIHNTNWRAAVQANLARRVRLLPFTYGTLSIKATAA